jgi:hypothetical protein
MGEISDMIIDGEICAFCTQSFTQAHGYPCACKDCWEPDCGYQKATYELI